MCAVSGADSKSCMNVYEENLILENESIFAIKV